ncbi:MAG TPA: hypothetical protein EYG68_03235 [Leucothrix mucor]|nr:hypothetical protein [Leucothrix mucor]
MAAKTIDNMSDDELFHTSMVNLKKALLQQSRTQRRVANRVRTLIRSVMVALGSSLIFILYLVYILTQQVNTISSSLDDMSQQAVAIQGSMNDVKHVMIMFETYMNEMPGIDVSISGIENSMANMTNSFAAITKNVELVSSELDSLKGSMQGVGHNTLVLNQVLHQVTADVADGARPIERFNSMNPFNFMR